MQVSRTRLFGITVFALLLGAAGRVQAGPLNPLDFTSLGAFPSVPGTYTYTFNGTTPTLSGPGGNLTGVLYSDAPGHQIAVFDFNSINLSLKQA